MGTLIIGVSSLIAVLNADNLLEEVLKIQKQGQGTHVLLKACIADVKKKKAEETFNSYPDLKKKETTKKEILRTIEPFSEKSMPSKFKVYLPVKELQQAAESIYKAKTPEKKKEAFANSLEHTRFPLKKKWS